MQNNLFNKIFRAKKLAAFNQKVADSKRIVGFYPLLIERLRNATSLHQLLKIHQDAWNLGFRNENLAPCEYGMFRTKSISDMTMEEVYMGGIYGLITENLAFWATKPNETMAGNGFGLDDSTLVYDLIMRQYRSHLRRNFFAVRDQSQDWLRKNL